MLAHGRHRRRFAQLCSSISISSPTVAELVIFGCPSVASSLMPAGFGYGSLLIRDLVIEDQEVGVLDSQGAD